jgi:uncharacterized membrane protein
VWLVGYCALLFFTVADTAAAGVEFFPSFVWLLLYVFVGYVQFRFPTVLGWVLLFIPTALEGCLIIAMSPVGAAEAIADHEFWRAGGIALMGIFFFTVLFGFIYYRPFLRKHVTEPNTGANRR